MVNFPSKRLQVFVSSTYTDLQHERQAAVEAILTAGHIPAGMELFTAGDESQMQVIQQWIDESDVYLLILGGRYGSIDAASGKSYTHREFDYAAQLGKPMFSLVIDEQHLDQRARNHGLQVIERENPQGLAKLRALALEKIVKLWADHKDIRIAISETLRNFSGRQELRGWVRPEDQTSVPQLAGEIARLSKENAELRERLSNSEQQGHALGISHPEMLRLLRAKKLLSHFIDNIPTLLDAWGIGSDNREIQKLLELGLVARLPGVNRIGISKEGQAFLNWYKLKELETSPPTGEAPSI